MSKKLQKQIAKKLDKLQELLDNIDEARIVNPDDPDTWDSDTLYDLVEQLKDALKLLEDQPIGKTDAFGQIPYEEGLCSLVDNYQNGEDDD